MIKYTVLFINNLILKNFDNKVSNERSRDKTKLPSKKTLMETFMIWAFP